jgi:hypothetical protein
MTVWLSDVEYESLTEAQQLLQQRAAAPARPAKPIVTPGAKRADLAKRWHTSRP